MVREVRLSDADEVSAITEASGWGPTTLAGWERLWRDNPALVDHDLPKGWVLEESDRVVGYFCNLAGRYRFGSRTLRVAAAGSLIVMPEHRGQSLQLLLRFAKQKNVDLLLNTTAAPHVSKICEFLKFTRIPQPDYDVSLYWVVGSREFVGAGLRKKGTSAQLARAAALALSGAAALYTKHRHQLGAAPPAGVTISVAEPGTVDDSFDDLWERQSRGERLMAFRDSKTLRWHLAPSRHQGWPFLVSAYSGRRLLGYAALVRQDAPHLGLTRARVADLFVEGDDRGLTGAILARGITEARRRGVAMVELIGFPESVRLAAKDLRPFELRSETWPFLFRADDPELKRALARPEAWYASLFDGDGSL